MRLSQDDVKKIAHLARLNMSETDLSHFTPQLSNIFNFVEQMNQIETEVVPLLAHPLDLSQRLRPDEVTELNQRDTAQAIAPQVEAGLYLVPKVIDTP